MKETIIVVEDEFLIARDIRNILLEEEYNVIIDIDSVEQALEAIEIYKPDLVITDINLKKNKDGIDLGQYLLDKDVIPYIYITSLSDRVTLDRASNTRPHGYIVKPFKEMDIKTTVALTLSNYAHRKIDVLRSEQEIVLETPFILKQTINFINENINENLKVSDLAQMTKWKSQHFQRLFTKYLGTTPHNYIISRKIAKAKSLLIETNLPATSISYELGFKSHSNFCSIFKKQTGKTPDKYRNWHETNTKYISH